MAVFAGNGSATSPSFTFSSDNNIGMYRIGADILGFSTNGAEALRIDGSGFVGISNSSPTAKLSVNGSVTIGTQANVAVRIGTGGTADLLLGSFNGNAPFVASEDILQLRTNNASQLTIGATGGVGVGAGVDADGAVKLNVGGGTSGLALQGLDQEVAYFGLGTGTNTFGGIVLGSGVNGNTPFVAASSQDDGTSLPLRLTTGGNVRLVVGATGNVGIGDQAASATHLLSVGGATSGLALDGLLNILSYTGLRTDLNTFGGVVMGSGLNGNSPYVAASKLDDGTALALSLITNALPRVQIAGTGEVSIGRPAGAAAGARIHAEFDAAASSVTHVVKLEADNAADGQSLRIAASAYTGNVSSAIDFIQNSDTNFKSQIAFFVNDGGGTGEAARIDPDSNLKIGGTADRATTAGSNQLVLFNGTAPVGTLVDGVSFYSASGEARVMDAAGNSTLLSPHDSVTNEWIYDSVYTPTGKRLRIRMEAMMKAINEHFGWDFVQEFAEA